MRNTGKTVLRLRLCLISKRERERDYMANQPQLKNAHALLFSITVTVTPKNPRNNRVVVISLASSQSPEGSRHAP